MMNIRSMSLRLDPSDHEKPRKERRHELAYISPHRGVGSQKSRLSQPFKHASSCRPRGPRETYGKSGTCQPIYLLRESRLSRTSRLSRSQFTSLYALDDR